MLITVGLYVSSLSTSGLQAFLLSSTALLGAALFGRLLIEPLVRAVSALSHPSSGVSPLAAVLRLDQPALLLAAGFIVLVLRFALVNHRSADRPARRVLAQVAWMAGYAAITFVVVTGLASF